MFLYKNILKTSRGRRYKCKLTYGNKLKNAELLHQCDMLHIVCFVRNVQCQLHPCFCSFSEKKNKATAIACHNAAKANLKLIPKAKQRPVPATMQQTLKTAMIQQSSGQCLPQCNKDKQKSNATAKRLC